METKIVPDGRPSIMVTNDDGIDAPGLRALVQVLVSTNRYQVLVCAPYSEKSAVSHNITWRHPLSAKKAEIDGTVAFAIRGTPADCTSLGLSKALFPFLPDLVISGINSGRSTVGDFTIAAEVVLPIINATISDNKNQIYTQKCFLNIDVPFNVKENKSRME